MRTLRSLAALGAGLALFAACRQTDSTAPSGILAVTKPSLSLVAGETRYSPELDQMRQALRASGVTNVELVSAEIMVAGDSAGWQGATTLLANNRTHNFGVAFVPSDPRRGGQASISYVVDQSDANALSRTSTGAVITLPSTVIEPEIDASMLRWQNQPGCHAPEIVKIADPGTDPDLIDGLVFNDPSRIGTPFADVTHAGWLPRAFFDALAQNGSSFILGVTFSFIFVDAAGVPTDIDHNGQLDAAFREIYYNRRFGWTATGAFAGDVDIQSVATHESGHAYGLGHFGKVFIDNNNVIKFAPRAVMTAVYVSPFRDLTGTDNSSFCALWASPR